MRQWRLIYDKPTSGARNMAIDAAILAAVGRGDQPPTLRVYDWSPFCLSLGYGQTSRDADMQRLEYFGWDIVRRPTGGRAILHGDELTYSVALPMHHELAHGDIVESYRRLSTALVAALEHLGLSPRSERNDDQPKKKGPVCFEVPSHYEITVNGHKLIGSAQVRRKNGILQHGSLPLRGDVARICQALQYESDGARQQAAASVRQRAVTLADVGFDVTWQTAADAIIGGFRDCFDVELIEGELSPAEVDESNALHESTYGNAEWTHRR